MHTDRALAQLDQLALVHRISQATFLWSRTAQALRAGLEAEQRRAMLDGFFHGVTVSAGLLPVQVAAAAYVIGLLTGEGEDALSVARHTLCADRDDAWFARGVEEALRMLDRAGGGPAGCSVD